MSYEFDEKREPLSKPIVKTPERSAEERPGRAEKIARQGTSQSAGMVPYLDQLQSSFSFDLKSIPCHTGPSAEEATNRLGADGFAHQGSIVLGDRADKRIVAEEVSHVAQQNRAKSGGAQTGLVGAFDGAEVEATAAADRAVSGLPVGPMSAPLGAQAVALGRKGKDFRGGKKKDRDNWYGYNDPEFQAWWHREGKAQFGGDDIDNAQEAKEAYDAWVAAGKPSHRGGNPHRDRGRGRGRR